MGFGEEVVGLDDFLLEVEVLAEAVGKLFSI